MFSDEESKQYGIYWFEMKDESDIKRSEFVKFVSRKYNNYRKLLQK